MKSYGQKDIDQKPVIENLFDFDINPGHHQKLGQNDSEDSGVQGTPL